MGITMPELVIHALLKKAFIELSADYIMEVFDSTEYDEDSKAKLLDYFGGRTIDVFMGYPTDEVSKDGIYVIPGNMNQDDTLLGDEAEVVDDEDATKKEMYSMELYKKSVRIMSAGRSPMIVTATSAIVQYMMMQGRTTFDAVAMQNMNLSYSEFDMLSRMLPTNLFYRSIMATFDVIDIYVSGKYGVIAGAKLEELNLLEGDYGGFKVEE